MGSVSLDLAAAKLKDWRDRERRLSVLKEEVAALREEFRAAMRACGAEVGTINGVDVISRAPTKTFRGADFAKERPDLAEQYTKPKVIHALDVAALAEELPEVYGGYLSEALRPNWKNLEVALSLAENSSGE